MKKSRLKIRERQKKIASLVPKEEEKTISPKKKRMLVLKKRKKLYQLLITASVNLTLVNNHQLKVKKKEVQTLIQRNKKKTSLKTSILLEELTTKMSTLTSTLIAVGSVITSRHHRSNSRIRHLWVEEETCLIY
jgi:hypothetical protein